jgi:large subunit ribosomal protein L25
LDLGEFGLALVKDIQFNPTSDVPIHMDFLRLKERVNVSIPLHFINEDRSMGIKRGAVLNVIYYTLQVSALSKSIPQELVVDLAGSAIGHTFHVSDIMLPEGVQILHLGADESVASIVAPAGLVESLKDSAS